MRLGVLRIRRSLQEHLPEQDGPAGRLRGEKKDDWKWANAELKGDEIVLSSPEVPEPKAVRYGWARRPRLTLESAHGLPLRPFSTDHGSTLDYGK